MSTECSHIEALLSAMQDGVATPAEVAQVDRHLATCERCRATAQAFRQIDQQVRRYLMATPVPEIATPWRDEPLLAPATAARRTVGHWRITVAGLALVFVFLLAGSLITAYSFGVRRGSESARVDTGAGQFTAAQEPTRTALPQPAAAAASAAPAGVGAPAASAAPSRSAAASSAPAPAGATPAGATRSGNPPVTTSAGVSSDNGTLNPGVILRLATATSVTLCRPACDPQPQSADFQRQVIAALTQPLPREQGIPESFAPIPHLTLNFRLADGTDLPVIYYGQIERLQLPNGQGYAHAPPELVALLTPLLPR